MELFRAHIIDVPGDPLRGTAGLRAIEDGALAIDAGRIIDLGNYTELTARFPQAMQHDWSGATLLPGMIDIHVHFPQLPVIGSMGLPLLSWLSERTLPAEAALDNEAAARDAARRFLRSLAANGTTGALVFGSHIAAAQEAFFQEAADSGLRICSGLALGDRELPAPLLRSADQCYRESRELIKRWHNKRGVRYALTPRFSVSCSEAVLEVCGALMREQRDLLFQSHINENQDEIALVRRQFPWADDYFATYERYGLTGRCSVYAHNLHPAPDECERMAAAQVAVAHCPSSNAFLGSGSFPMQQHLKCGMRFAVASDVGGGTGFSLFKEGLAAYEMQRQRDDGVALDPAALLYLVTGAPAAILGMGDHVGSLDPGMLADFVIVAPASDGTLAAVLDAVTTPEQRLGALFTLAREECIAATYVGGREIYRRSG
ncbi:MAG: guanine deaminase [Spirochaetaceae bacterium]|nr:MAG: guanine deaminase [Spirochaetaceae bacterium]